MTALTRLRVRRRLRALRPRRATARLLVLRRSRLAMAVAIPAVALPAAAFSGPVGAALAVVYAALALACVLRRSRSAAEDHARTLALDAVAALAADLRAGISPVVAWTVAREPIELCTLVHDRATVGWRVADATGAPLADLLDRLQRDLRAVEGIRLAAAAHAAGIRATAVLLAVLPLGGIGLGYGMGGDPLRVLLHTPLGAGCAGVATVLQLVGFGWTSRLARVVR